MDWMGIYWEIADGPRGIEMVRVSISGAGWREMFDVTDVRAKVRKWRGNETGFGPEFGRSTFHSVYVVEN